MLNAQFDHGHVLFLFLFCINFCSTVKNALCCIASDAKKRCDDMTPKISVSAIVNVPIYYVLPTLAEHGYDH